MGELPLGFARLYASALRSQLTRSGEYPLHQAYELGRLALRQGLGVLDLAALHHDALAELSFEDRADDDVDTLALASEFLAECLSPFEMVLRGYQEANARLTEANADLTRTSEALAQANEHLRTEVAERQKAEEALLHAQKLQAIGLLAGGVAHHFNNLLTVVLGNLEMARRRVTDQTVERLLVAARRGAERGAEVTKQLLTFSRQQVLHPRTIEPGQWLADFAPLLTNALRGDIVVETDVRGATSPLDVDPSQLELAILNLAVNARDAMPGGGLLRLAVENRNLHDDRIGPAGDYVVFEVSDTGVGVAPDILPRVFEPFFSTKEGGPGAGLGLSQVHGFVHQSGGFVEIESRLGEGTTVRLYLPVSAELVVDRPPDQPIESEVTGTGCVLVVEDDVAVADTTAELLQSCGYSVRLAYRAQAALDLMVGGESVDLIFSDVVMPGGMNGVELAEEVRRRFPNVPILLATGYSDAIAGLNDKGLAVITKPYSGDILCRRIDELLRPVASGRFRGSL